MRWSIYAGKQMVAKALDAELAVSIATSGMVTAYPIYIKSHGRVALRLDNQTQVMDARESYDRTTSQMFTALTRAAEKSRAAYEKKWPRTSASNSATALGHE